MNRIVLKPWLALGLLAFVSMAAEAASVTAVSPQGEVAQARQLRLKFSEAVVQQGDPRLPDPARLVCEGLAAVPGSGRWSSASEWLFELNEPLPAGARCKIQLRAEFKALGGELSGPREFGFNTGAPSIVQTEPWSGSQIEEEQHFLLQLTGPVTEASVNRQAWCEAEGIGERLPVKVVGGAPREALLKARRIAAKAAERWLLLACQRPLPPGAKVQLVWGPGIASALNPQLLTRAEQRFDYRVREPLTAEFSCERERAGAPCLPIRPLSLRFSEPVPRALAMQARLKPASGAAIAPQVDKDDKSPETSELRFPTPLAENASFTLELPAGLKDASGRSLSNAASFPLKVATGGAPPIAKFAAAPFGVIEREAEGPALLPITLRHVQQDLAPGQAPGPTPGKTAGQVRIKRLGSDAEVLAAYLRVKRWHETQLPARELGLPSSQWTETHSETNSRGQTISRKVDRYVATREVAMLDKDASAQRLDLPVLAQGERPFEVIALPISTAGYHLVELSSPRLGRALLDKAAPMYVRTGVLVTNLGVHFKWGRENSLVWVTSLDRGRPVAGVEVAVNDCRGQRLWAGKTDGQGLATVPQALEMPRGQRCEGEYGFFVTARKAEDMAFVFSNWNRGIESWRFNVPTARGAAADARAHTVLDRSLLRAGETVSMKHFFRIETGLGLSLAKPEQLPTRLKITHEGSGQEFVQPLQWEGSRSAASSWNIPPAAKLGVYRLELEREGADSSQRRSWPAGDFRVEEFRVPLVEARLSAPKGVLVAPAELQIGAQLNYLSGGGMAATPLRVSAMLRPRGVAFAGYEDFNFQPPGDPSQPDADEDAEASAPRDSKLVADKLAFTTDRQGAASIVLKALPKLERPSELLTEVSFNDPNGELQTAAQLLPLWPSKLVLGLKASSWASNRGKVAFKVVALDTAGKPVAGQKIAVRARLTQTLSSRKRMVGGFYAYDNRTELKDLGEVCSGTSDAKGLLQCEAALDTAGQIDLIAAAKDGDGRPAQAATGVWITGQGELWFAQDNDDRIDVLPEKRAYAPGETARLQVRMPFREATALVAIEREGILDTQVVQLRGDDPTVEVKISKAWAPNVYVSVLALRGRIRDVPWYSFFSWGWKAPRDWWRDWRASRDYQAPTAMVDLSKPAFKLGVASLQVGLAEHQLQVAVTTDKPQYGVRQTVQARIKVSQDGKPLAGAELAFAAVDEGLLALRPNGSWDLLTAMLQQRSWGVETASAQSEIIGRRHYGRKAVAAGGGGGRGGTRELFDTLLLWQPRVQLDAKGEALIEVPLNDSLSSFRLVAIADAGAQKFGSGAATVRVTQDLQLLSGLPPLVREGDQFQAMLTVRNSTGREMKLRASLAGTANSGAEAITRTPLALPPQDLTLAAGAARELQWAVTVPAGAFSLAWEAEVSEQGASAGAGARDRMKFTQAVVPAVPVRVLQASLAQLEGRFSLPVAAPGDALPASGIKQGGLNIALQPRLTGALPGLRRFFESYPYTCLEQLSSKALGLQDDKQWQALMARLPTYLDAEGLASYFPPSADAAPRGSDRLTAYLLSASHEAGQVLPEPARTAMLDGLTAFVEGRITRQTWSPKPDLELRRLAALEALSRHGRAHARMLATVDARNVSTWPTAALIDWLLIHQRLSAAPERDKRLAEAQAQLRGRLSYAGSTLKFSNEESDAWWLMDSADGNAARLILAVLNEPGWKEELPRLLQGALGRQQRGAWSTTTANLWGVLALEKFAARFEAGKPSGKTVASLGGKSLSLDWAARAEGGALLLPWPAEPAATLNVEQQGSGKPWMTVQSLAAIPLKAALNSGYRISRSLQAIEQKTKGQWSRGDVVRVRLELEAQADMSWVVLSDPVPGGATILGSGLGGQSGIAVQGEKREGTAWTAYEERGFEAWRGYYEFLPRGKHVIEYTLRLNNAGRFQLPPTRVEAMYAPDSFGELPNAALEVGP
ncbi:alpha-2-macroglobulin family protein [Roseateles cavernae]|uniref:alpha-2-macroglobulin family protein n=1 Tax=Roseateles cavernae TaxID=3153578 RepID=UPI0032E3E471